MVLDINFPPITPVPPGEQRPMPTDEELDALFTKIGEQAAEPLGMARLLLGGFSSFLIGNKALVELLIAKGVIGEESREQVHEIANEMNAQSGRQSVRDFIGFAAKGLVKVGGKPLAPDDVATLVSMFVDDQPDFGAAFSTMTRSVLPPDHLVAFYAKAKASDEPFKVLMNYRVHEDPAEAKVKELTKKVSELSESVLALTMAVSRLKEDRRADKAVIENLEQDIERQRKDGASLREEVAAFRGCRD